MSLASTAAAFDSDNQSSSYSEYNSNDTPVNKKRLAINSNHNKTQKRSAFTNMDFNPEKVNSVLQSIHNNSTDNELGDFNPKRNQATPTSVEQFKPLIHIFGHIHHSNGIMERNGTNFINASICTERYKPTNKPIVIDLKEQDGKIIVSYID